MPQDKENPHYRFQSICKRSLPRKRARRTEIIGGFAVLKCYHVRPYLYSSIYIHRVQENMHEFRYSRDFRYLNVNIVASMYL